MSKVVRVRDRVIPLFVERDLGTERGDALPEKIRRYRSVATGRPELLLTVGFVVESERRARAIHELVRAGRGLDAGPAVVTAIAERLQRDPIGALWSDGQTARATRQLAHRAAPASPPILGPGRLADGDDLAALDDRGAAVLPSPAPIPGAHAARNEPR